MTVNFAAMPAVFRERPGPAAELIFAAAVDGEISVSTGKRLKSVRWYRFRDGITEKESAEPERCHLSLRS